MRIMSGLVGAALLAGSGGANAAPYYFVDWTAANAAAGTAAGVITLPDLSTVAVGFSVTQAGGAPGSFFFSQTAGGTNYWSPTTPYLSSQVSNAPPSSDIIALVGGSSTTTYTLTLSEAIKDPIMDIVSLGAPGRVITYDFNRPFDIVSQGVGYWGGGANALQELAGDVLQGEEGHGTIQFIGTFSTFSWTAPISESWHGIQFGIRTAERLEPNPPPAGVPEPGTLAVLGLGIAGLGAVRRRNHKA